MAKLSETKIFNNPELFVEGWYWALPSAELAKGRVKGVEILGRSIALYRGISGRVFAVEAYCPHMGAHFKEGKVDGDSIRCAFHGWKFEGDGRCSDIPCQANSNHKSRIEPLETFRVAEKYGLIWIHTGRGGVLSGGADDPLPTFAEFGEDTAFECVVGARTFRACRPEVVMLNAIDAHHFNTVHPEASHLADGLNLLPTALSPHAIRLENTSPPTQAHAIGRFLKRFYRNERLTYSLDYWYASTGVVTLGPDFLHLYLLFPHRPTPSGGTEGIMVFIARRKAGWLGRMIARTIARITLVVGGYFEKGDRRIFDSIRFEMKAAVQADRAIIEFIRHTERQTFGTFPWNAGRTR